MLLFQDILELTKSEARKHIENLDEKDVIFDQTEHAHITVRLVRYEKTVDNFDTKLQAIMNELKKLPFVQSLEYENGYINIITDGWYLLNAMHESLQTTGSFPESFQDPERVSVEHTSTNPTGPIHMGRIRNSIIGDSIARLMEKYGYRVVTQYYVNDSGKQMVSLYLGYEKFHKGEALTKEILLDGYKKIYGYFEQKGDEKEVELLMEKYEKGDDNLISQIKNIAQIMLDDIVSDLELINIKMDEFTWESEFIVTGETEEVIKDLSEYIQDENGAMYIDVPNVRKIFVKRKNGTSLYVTRDIAYHMYKFSQYDKCIVVVGEDHKEHGKIMDYVMHQLLDYKNSLDFVYYGMVNLESGRMSTRKGTSVTVILTANYSADKYYGKSTLRYNWTFMFANGTKIPANTANLTILKYNSSASAWNTSAWVEVQFNLVAKIHISLRVTNPVLSGYDNISYTTTYSGPKLLVSGVHYSGTFSQGVTKEVQVNVTNHGKVSVTGLTIVVYDNGVLLKSKSFTQTLAVNQTRTYDINISLANSGSQSLSFQASNSAQPNFVQKDGQLVKTVSVGVSSDRVILVIVAIIVIILILALLYYRLTKGKFPGAARARQQSLPQSNQKKITDQKQVPKKDSNTKQ